MVDCILMNAEYIALSNIARVRIADRAGKYELLLHEVDDGGVNRRLLITKRQFEAIKPLLHVVLDVDRAIKGSATTGQDEAVPNWDGMLE